MIQSLNVLDDSAYEQAQNTVELEYEFLDRKGERPTTAGTAETVRIKSLNLYPRFAHRLDQVCSVWPELGNEIASCLLSFAEGMIGIYADIVKKQITLPVTGQYRYRRAMRHMIKMHGRAAALNVTYWFQAYLHPSYESQQNVRTFFADFSNPFIRLSLRGLLHVVRINDEFCRRTAQEPKVNISEWESKDDAYSLPEEDSSC